MFLFVVASRTSYRPFGSPLLAHDRLYFPIPFNVKRGHTASLVTAVSGIPTPDHHAGWVRDKSFSLLSNLRFGGCFLRHHKLTYTEIRHSSKEDPGLGVWNVLPRILILLPLPLRVQGNNSLTLKTRGSRDRWHMGERNRGDILSQNHWPLT